MTVEATVKSFDNLGNPIKEGDPVKVEHGGTGVIKGDNGVVTFADILGNGATYLIPSIARTAWARGFMGFLGRGPRPQVIIPIKDGEETSFKIFGRGSNAYDLFTIAHKPNVG